MVDLVEEFEFFGSKLVVAPLEVGLAIPDDVSSHPQVIFPVGHVLSRGVHDVIKVKLKSRFFVKG